MVWLDELGLMASKHITLPNPIHSAQGLCLNWFNFFLANIPPAHPVLLIENEHASHITVEKARSNDVHMLYLPAHTTHILQLL